MSSASILIVAPAWVGDMVMMHSLCRLLRQNDPEVSIDVLASPAAASLTAFMPEVRETHVLPLSHGQFALRARYAMGKRLRQYRYDQAIVLPNSWKSALVPFFAKIKKRTGWRGEWRYGLLNDIRLLDKQAYPLMIERFIALGLPKDAPLPAHYPWPRFTVISRSHQPKRRGYSSTEPVIQGCKGTGGQEPVSGEEYPCLERRDAENTPILVLCPGAAYGPAKRWPPEHFAAIANQKLSEGWQVWILGARGDSDIDVEGCIDFTGKTSLSEAVHLLSRADMVLTNDSGLMHIACALQRKVVAVYGSSSPQYTPPLGDQVRICSLNLPCSPCFKRVCPLGHRKCLYDLLPSMVDEAMEELLTS